MRTYVILVVITIVAIISISIALDRPTHVGANVQRINMHIDALK
jgi:hypothetical protein